VATNLLMIWKTSNFLLTTETENLLTIKQSSNIQIFFSSMHKFILNTETRMLLWHSTRTQGWGESLTRRLFCKKLVLHMYYCNAIISVSCTSRKIINIYTRDKIQYLETALQEKIFLYVFWIENYISYKLCDNLVPLCSIKVKTWRNIITGPQVWK